MGARSVFIPLAAPEYQLLALQPARRAPEGPISPSRDLQIRLAAEINGSATKCAVTNAESGGRKQIEMEKRSPENQICCFYLFLSSGGGRGGAKLVDWLEPSVLVGNPPRTQRKRPKTLQGRSVIFIDVNLQRMH